MLLVTYRHLIRNRLFTSINIVGLTIGIAAFILIKAYTGFEKSYDRIHADNIYRVESQFYKGDQLTDNWATSTNGYAKAMKDNIPGILSYTRINWYDCERVIRYNDQKYREDHVCFADSNFFSFFSYPLLKGDVATVLQEANSIVVSESAARKYFGDADPMGKTVEVSTKSRTYNCMVTGVFKDIPANATMQFNFLLSWNTSAKWLQDFWYMHESYTFVQLQPGTSPSSVEAQFPAVAEKYKTGPAFKDLKWAIQLTKLPDMHLNPYKQYEIETKGNRYATQLLDIIAYIILIIASINYINIATAKAIDRAREAGIRKVIGAHSLQVLFQFMLESFLVYTMALILSALIVFCFITWLPGFFNNGISGLLLDTSLFIHIGLVFFAAILLSGIYPGLVLLKIKPVAVLKGQLAVSGKGILLRKGMVAFQFIASLLLIAGTLTVYRQINYMTHQGIGANIDQTVIIKAPVHTDKYAQKMQSLKNALQAIPGVAMVTASGAVPGKQVGKFLANRRFGASTTEERMYEMLKVDHDFIKAYGLQIIAGRAFDKGRPADSMGLVLNESAVQQFGFASPAAAIGQKVWLETVDKRPNEIIGVISNYHQQSLQNQYTPFILFMDPALDWIPASYFSVKMNTAAIHSSVNLLQQTWHSFFPESSFDYFFLDEFYAQQYQQEKQFGRNFLLFSSLAIIIACIGLFGLTVYSTARRTKEIGIRKVLGASVQSIVSLLTREVIVLILWCSLIAIPGSILLTLEWLKGYAFSASLTWWQFASPVLILIVIALATTALQSIKAALSNPTKALKNE
jgi:putative ABC transport system permease protein